MVVLLLDQYLIVRILKAEIIWSRLNYLDQSPISRCTVDQLCWFLVLFDRKDEIFDGKDDEDVNWPSSSVDSPWVENL